MTAQDLLIKKYHVQTHLGGLQLYREGKLITPKSLSHSELCNERARAQITNSSSTCNACAQAAQPSSYQ